jgi:hypothetical protein
MNHSVRLVAVYLTCLLTACTSPLGGDVGCLKLASYAERIECQTKPQRIKAADEDILRKAAPPASSQDSADPICYLKPAAGEKACAK